MVLKNSIQFNFDICDTESHLGLSEGDFWCNVSYSILDKKKEINMSCEMISFLELKSFLKEIEVFLDLSHSDYKRVSFIKNFIVVYLEAFKKRKVMTIKFIHIDDNKSNYYLKLENDEIIEFLNIIKKYFYDICKLKDYK